MASWLSSSLGLGGGAAANTPADADEAKKASLGSSLSSLGSSLGLTAKDPDAPKGTAELWAENKSNVRWREKQEKIAYATFLKNHYVVSFPTTSEDAEFEQALAEFLKIEDSVLACGDHVLAYLSAARLFLKSMPAGREAFSTSAALGPEGSVEWTSAMEKMEAAFSNTVCDRLHSEVMPSLLQKAQATNAVYTHVEKRAMHKLNFDYYTNKVTKLESDSNGEMSEKQRARLEGNIEKRGKAQADLQAVTAALMKVLTAYKAAGGKILQHEFVAMKAAHLSLYNTAFTQLSGLDQAATPLDLPVVGAYAADDADLQDEEVAAAKNALQGNVLLDGDAKAADADAAPPPLPPRA